MNSFVFGAVLLSVGGYLIVTIPTRGEASVRRYAPGTWAAFPALVAGAVAALLNPRFGAAATSVALVSIGLMLAAAAIPRGTRWDTLRVLATIIGFCAGALVVRVLAVPVP
ncbi:hypothetical protein [Sanguibacter sp. 25GB23B1]|uniref:hypothetical protein n=1 Tax=unclassified Sanguibacter TaxID=2645534 RepID=UPI0032AFD964